MSDQEIKVSHKNFRPFMMIPDAIWEMGLTHDQFVLYSRLVHHANQTTNSAWPSRKSLILKVYSHLSFDRGRKNFDIAMKRLCELKMVEKSRRFRDNGSNQSSEYLLNYENDWVQVGSKTALPLRVKNGPKPLGSKTALSLRVKNGPNLNQIQSEPDPTKNNTNTNKREDLTAGCVAPLAVTPSPVVNLNFKKEKKQSLENREGTVFESSLFECCQDTQTDLTLTDVPAGTESVNQEPKKRQKRASTPKELSDGSKIWIAYEHSYEKKYSTKPIRNAKQNALCSQLAQRLGAGAIPVVEFYLTHRNRFYVEHTHALGLLVKDAESLHTQMLRGQAMTTTQARNVDKQSAEDEFLQQQMKRIEEKYKGQIL